MPFFDDTGVKTEVERGPLWSAFSTFASQLERMIVVNLGWSVQLLPAIIGIAFFQLPTWLRLLLIIYTLAALPPATAALYGVTHEVADDEHINPDVVRDMLRRLALPGLKTLTPLYGSLGFLAWAAQNTGSILLVSALLQLALLIELVSAHYWGPLLVENPQHSALAVLRDSLLMVWRYPSQTALLTGAVALALLLGTISIGGLFLAVPVIIALLQTYMFRTIKQGNHGTVTSY
ncbi:MAG: hypothetical protein K8L99_27045 [Anaerolineae bacterium]|nr:hypothetical protein [Anaerolineae bacterium]